MELFTHNVAAWLGAAVVGILSVFSDRIIGRIRFQLNRADLRVRYYEELATDLSAYLFYAGLYEERLRRGWTGDPDDIAAIISEMNGAVTILKKKEFVYRAWAHRYWGSVPAESLIDVLRMLDRLYEASYAFNDAGDEPKNLAEFSGRLNDGRVAVERWLIKASL